MRGMARVRPAAGAMWLAMAGVLAACASGNDLGLPDRGTYYGYCPGDNIVLPERFTIYVTTDGHAYTAPGPGRRAVQLPSPAAYRGEAGCYLVCLTENQSAGLYTLSDGRAVVGQVRVPGSYWGSICEGMKPTGFSYSELCERAFPEVCAQESCRVGFDTGSWFGC